MTDDNSGLKIDTLDDCKKYLAKVIQERESLRVELKASIKILAAVIITHSGTVRVPEKTMIQAHNNETFLQYKKDLKTKEDVIKVTVKPIEKKRIITLHEESGRIIQ